MKKTYKIFALVLFSFLIVHCTFTIKDCICQWEPDVRLTNNPDSSRTSSNNAWCTASNGNIIHAVWYDNRDANNEIYYKRSTDGGLNWGTDTRLTNDVSFSELPSIAVFGSIVHVVWDDQRDGNKEIYYKHSTDGGITWTSDTRLTNDNAASGGPSIALSESVVHIVWIDHRDGNYEVYYKQSTNAGINWGADIRLTNAPFEKRAASLSISGSVIHVAWYDYRDGNYEVYYKHSTDAGANWEADKRLTQNSGYSIYPSISASGANVNIVWEDNRDGNYEIYYKKSTNQGDTWGTDIRLTNNSASSIWPSISTSGSSVHVAWMDIRDGNYEIYYNRSTDAGTTWETDTRLTNATGSSYYPSVSVSGLLVHVVWMDIRDGNYEIYYKRNPNGNPTGITNINTETPKEFKLEQNYPNPFNPMTKIRFFLNMDSRFRGNDNVVLKVFDILGKEAATLVNEQLKPGTYEVTFDGSNYSSGIYFYKLSATEFTDTKRMFLIK